MTEKPFIHKYAYADVKSNFIFHEDLIKLLVKVLDKKGIYNVIYVYFAFMLSRTFQVVRLSNLVRTRERNINFN